MSVYLNYLADELIEIEETLAAADLAPHAGRLEQAIARVHALTREAAAAATLAFAEAPPPAPAPARPLAPERLRAA